MQMEWIDIQPHGIPRRRRWSAVIASRWENWIPRKISATKPPMCRRLRLFTSFFLNTKVKWASLGVKLVLLKLPCPTTFTSLFVSREAFNWFNYHLKTYTFNKKTYLGICLQPFAKIFGFNILLKAMKTGLQNKEGATVWLGVLQ